jgi:hypothetical protein
MPKSSASLAVKMRGALTGTTPEATSSPLTLKATLISAASAVGIALQDISPAARKLNLKGELLVEAKADVTGKVYYNLPSVLWVAPQKVLGGNVGFGAIVPFGSKDVDFRRPHKTTVRVTASETSLSILRHFFFHGRQGMPETKASELRTPLRPYFLK